MKGRPAAALADVKSGGGADFASFQGITLGSENPGIENETAKKLEEKTNEKEAKNVEMDAAEIAEEEGV